MRVRVTQLDGKMPNLACMRLASYWRDRGAEVVYSRSARRNMFEGEYDLVYGSSIFQFSASKVARFRREFPDAIVGGTGVDTTTTLEELLPDIGQQVDYGDHEVDYSLGFLQRGCRLKCKFCVVPTKEGKPVENQTVSDLWRGDPWPRKLHILDNDFFGVPEWRDRIEEIREGGFKVCLSQGINVRLIDDEGAAALASVRYMDSKFANRRLYTAWDNLGQERIFFNGVDRLERAGIPARHIMAYMLIGYAPHETLEDIQYRFQRMVDRGIRPYPMVYDVRRKDLKRFQRWAIRRFYEVMTFEQFCADGRITTRPDTIQAKMEF